LVIFKIKMKRLNLLNRSFLHINKHFQARKSHIHTGSLVNEIDVHSDDYRVKLNFYYKLLLVKMKIKMKMIMK